MILNGDSKEVLKTLECAIPGCGKTFERYRTKGKNSFCSRKHKEKGMTLGLCNPSRLGTGYGVADILRRRKFYKYRLFDKARGFKGMEMGVREFCRKLSESSCEYCCSMKDVGLDRISNKDGHHEGNTVWACNLCNMTRGDRFTVEQMRQIGKVIATFHE